MLFNLVHTQLESAMTPQNLRQLYDQCVAQKEITSVNHACHEIIVAAQLMIMATSWANLQSYSVTFLVS